MTESWTVGRWLADASRRLLAESPEGPREARLLVLAVLALPPAAVLANPDRELSEEQFTRLEEMVGERLRGTPLQHLTGQAPFRHLELSVGPGVFVPRPETEGLVDMVLSHLRRGAAGLVPRVLELCAGTGAIGLSLIREAPPTEVAAIELSELALACARGNARRLLTPEESPRYVLYPGDLYAPLSGRQMPNSFDVVVANPPYIPDGMWGTLPREVRVHESPLALLGGPDGTSVVARISAGAPSWLRRGGLLAMEIDESHGGRVCKLLGDDGYVDVRIEDDLTERPRYALARVR
ncbi:MAG: peptide chain release factor N(5)-glutamine methyltransferase [Candidatus Eisenbacteria bacterium]|nr:peptide chain release factor N(5)-glutamine methyltransferase [Candidatus Eisenbacteria bacterium]